MAEVVIGTLRIIMDAPISAIEQRGRMSQLVEILIYGEQYKWDKVRALYHEALKQITRKQRKWEQPLSDLQTEMLRNWDTLPVHLRINLRQGSPLPTFASSGITQMTVALAGIFATMHIIARIASGRRAQRQTIVARHAHTRSGRRIVLHLLQLQEIQIDPSLGGSS